MPPSDVVRAYRFFRGRMCRVGWDAKDALDLARAEQHASRRGWTYEWVDDPDGWPEGGVCSSGCGARITTCESCILRSRTGRVLASLGAVWDADGAYRRQVEAELAWEAMP